MDSELLGYFPDYLSALSRTLSTLFVETAVFEETLYDVAVGNALFGSSLFIRSTSLSSTHHLTRLKSVELGLF